MEKVVGLLQVICMVDCPHCESGIDLFEDDDLKDDGVIYKALLEDNGMMGGWGNKDWDKRTKCPECKKEFKVGLVEY